MKKTKYEMFISISILFVVAILLQGCDSGSVSTYKGFGGKGIYEKKMLGKKLSKKEENIANMAKMNNEVGLSEFQKRRFDKAVVRFKKAIEVIPDYVDAVNNLGRTYYMMGKFGAALVTLKQAQKIAEGQGIDNKKILSSIHANIGDIYRQRKKYNDAIMEYQEVLRLTPILPRAHYEIGSMFLKQGKYKQAIYRFNKALELDINHNKALLDRAISWYCIDEPKKAWQDIIEIENRGLSVNEGFKHKVLRGLKNLKKQVNDRRR